MPQLKSQKLPNFSYEKKLWRRGFRFVVGVDEVGRGAWAGPVVTAACAFTPQIKNLKLKIENLGINDSKLLKPKEREKLAKEIKKYALAWDVTQVGVGVINKIGIGKATQKAMRKTISDLAKKGFQPDFVLVDYFYIPYLRGLGLENQHPIKNGDQKCFSIAAASILAKVYRDQLMRRLARKYPQYGWGRNKGYGTRLHQKAILRYGLTRFHRKAFVKTWLAKKNS